MVRYIFCKCGKVVDEYESKCFWCQEPNPDNSSVVKSPKQDDSDSNG